MIWIDFLKEKPKNGQLCIVAASATEHQPIAQHVALEWDENEKEFYWSDAVDGIDPFPTECAMYWMPWPSDPEITEDKI